MLGRLGKKQLEVAAAFSSTLMTFGGAAFLTMVYFTDWKVVAANIPFYGSKFPATKDEDEQE